MYDIKYKFVKVKWNNENDVTEKFYNIVCYPVYLRVGEKGVLMYDTRYNGFQTWVLPIITEVKYCRDNSIRIQTQDEEYVLKAIPDNNEENKKKCVKMAGDTEELIETLQYLISPNCCETQYDYRHEIKLAIVKLKRNIPIKVTRNNDGEIPCPNCKNILDRKQFRCEFCSRCGQALDWNKAI